ncbi:MAG: hypothetical protein Kow00107_02860 [Planctomycetota bacterium]
MRLSDTRRLYSVDDEFFELFDRMTGETTVSAALMKVAQVVHDVLECDRATVYIRDNSTDELVSCAVIGSVAREIRIPVSPASLAGYCALSGEAFVVPDAYSDLSSVSPTLVFDRSWDEVNNYRTRDVICAPAVFKGEVLGVVQGINGIKKPFDASALRPLKSVARLVAYTLFHARLYEDIASMKQLEKEKASFMRIMVHELKTPVAASKMLVDVIRNYHEIPDKTRNMVDRIGVRLDQLLEMTADVLSLADVKSGIPLSMIKVFDASRVISAITAQYAELASGKGLELKTELPKEELPIRFDPDGFRLVISNLVSNAVKYTPKGEVRVCASAEANKVTIRVSDTGMGIPANDIPKLFEPFHRASNARSSKISGSGVGLAGVKDIVERFGGSISLESELNMGSTFTVEIAQASR